MAQYRPGTCLSLFLATSFIALGCGTSRQLQSVNLSPATADAQNFPNNEVQFSATGMFSKPPSPQLLSSQDVFWCVGSSTGTCVGFINPGATIDQNGLAKCVLGFAGTSTILAGKATPAMNPDTGAQMTVFGAAQLTCP